MTETIKTSISKNSVCLVQTAIVNNTYTIHCFQLILGDSAGRGGGWIVVSGESQMGESSVKKRSFLLQSAVLGWLGG